MTLSNACTKPRPIVFVLKQVDESLYDSSTLKLSTFGWILMASVVQARFSPTPASFGLGKRGMVDRGTGSRTGNISCIIAPMLSSVGGVSGEGGTASARKRIMGVKQWHSFDFARFFFALSMTTHAFQVSGLTKPAPDHYRTSVPSYVFQVLGREDRKAASQKQRRWRDIHTAP